MALSDDQVRRLARLARIAIRPEDSAPVVERLNRVLGMIDQLRAVDTTGIEPMSHALEAHLPSRQRMRFAFRAALVGALRRSKRKRRLVVDEGVQFAIQPADALQIQASQLDGGNFLCCQGSRELGKGGVQQGGM